MTRGNFAVIEFNGAVARLYPRPKSCRFAETTSGLTYCA
jgi:hypothetical protein